MNVLVVTFQYNGTIGLFLTTPKTPQVDKSISSYKCIDIYDEDDALRYSQIHIHRRLRSKQWSNKSAFGQAQIEGFGKGKGEFLEGAVPYDK